MPEIPLDRLLELALLLELTRHGLSSSRSRTVMVLVVSTVRIIVGRPMDEPGLVGDGLASSFLPVEVVVVVVDDRLTLVVVLAAIPFLLSGVEDETDVTRLDDVDRVETGSAALRLETGVVGLLDDVTGRLIPVVLLTSSTFSDWISFSNCKNSVTESSAAGESATAGFLPFWAEMGVLVRRGMLHLIRDADGDDGDLALDLLAPLDVLEEL
jgi:hypothetical protein